MPIAALDRGEIPAGHCRLSVEAGDAAAGDAGAACSAARSASGSTARPCHSELGDGHGMVVQRGFPAPPSYHIARLREAPVAHFYDVITNGYGAMYSFAYRVQPADRWAIAAYIRALQRSQNAKLADLTPEQKAALQ